MQDMRIRRVVIVGGGTAGWMSAALLTKVLGTGLSITLIESDEIGTVGVGEATIPPIQVFNQAIGMNEADFVKATGGTFKLGIEFENWGGLGDRYMHAFGTIGRPLGLTPFHNFWLRARQAGRADAGSLWNYSFNYQAASRDRYARLDRIPNSPLEGIVEAYHFDAGLYARFLRQGSEAGGVKRIEGMIMGVNRDGENGFIRSVTLKSGETVEGDLFIDCSGFRALLIGEALGVGYEDWTRWLPCDRAIAVPAENGPRLRPYTQSIAHKAGWQWRIPLQHRAGNGHVFSSNHMSEDEAAAILMGNLEGKPLADPRTIRFRTGRRATFWEKNCVSVGLSSGFLEPLESTSIHLIQTSIVRLVQMFPDLNFAAANIAEYNAQVGFEYERVRDFIILHYHLNRRTDSAFWTACREMAVPESLTHRLDLFRQTGRIFRENNELFSEVAWLQVMVGQGLMPESFTPLADKLSDDQLGRYLADLRQIIDANAGRLPGHREAVARLIASAV
ncbi:tryptophan halogenase family protein [Gimibacter soli]